MPCNIALFNFGIFADDISRQTTALAILVASMKCSSDKDPLCYIYQQYDVSTCIDCLAICIRLILVYILLGDRDT